MCTLCFQVFRWFWVLFTGVVHASRAESAWAAVNDLASADAITERLRISWPAEQAFSLAIKALPLEQACHMGHAFMAA